MSEGGSERERAALEALGYPGGWLTSGLLERRLLAEQYERLQAGGSRKTGRYRAQAVADWLAREGPLGDAEIDTFLALMREDADQKMARGAIAELIRSPRLDLDQLGRIAGSDAELMRRHEPLIRRTYLTRRLREEVTDALVQQVVELKDASIQTMLVRDSRLSRKQAERLGQAGANPTIRDNVRAWLLDKKAWRS